MSLVGGGNRVLHTDCFAHPATETFSKGELAMLGILLIILLVILALAAFPTWPYSSDWGYVPSGLFGVLLVVVIVLLVFRVLRI
jgi:uncharacterized protein DUF3309